MEIKKSLLAAGVMAAGLLGVGCGISPGDYVIYRVAPSADVDASDGCFPSTMWQGPVANEASDSSTVRASSTWIIYASIDDKLYLDSGTNTLEGAVTDDGYNFSGKIVDVEWETDGGTTQGTGYKLTTTTTFTVNVITDGDAISGTAEKKTTFGCNGTTCPMKIPNCVEKTPFVGTHVEDIELKHDI